MLNPMYYLMLSTGDKITITQIQGGVPQMPIATREEKEEFIRDWIVPTANEKKFKQFILDWGMEPATSFPYFPSIDVACELVDWQEAMNSLDNCTGICNGISARPLKSAYNNQNLPLMISSATGLDIDEAELWKITRRNRNLLRAINA